MSLITDLLAEITESCAGCGGTGRQRYVTRAATPARPAETTAHGIVIPGTERAAQSAEYAEGGCWDCNGRGVELTADGAALVKTLISLLGGHFAERSHGHEIS